MYFVADKGNNLYVSTFRLVTNLDTVFERLEKKRIEFLKDIATGRYSVHQSYHDDAKKGISFYLKHWGGPVVYVMTPNKNEPPERITRQKLIELAKEWEGKQ